MAVVFMDGFDYYSGTSYLSEIYAETITGFTSFVTGRSGTANAFQTVTNSGMRAWLASAIGPTVGAGMGFQTNSAGSGPNVVVALQDGTTVQVDLRWDLSTRKFYFTRNGTTIASGTTAFAANQWYHVEIKVLLHASAGTVALRINGIAEITATGLNTMATANNTINRVAFSMTGGGGGNNIYDDVFVWDTSGSINTDWLGDCRIETLFPSGAGTTTQWTPSTGSNYQNVDETSPNNDTDYNYSATAGQIDTFALPNLGASSGTVMAVQSVLRHRKDDAGSRTLRRVFRSGSTNYEGADISVLDGYSFTREILEADPNTSSRWTVTNVNALEAGYKMQA